MKHLAIYLLAGMGLVAVPSSLEAQTFNSLYSFSALQGTTLKTNTDGRAPYGNLVLSGGTLFGTTYSAGTNGTGTIYCVETNGSNFTVLHSFAPLVNQTNADGANPYSGLVLSGGILYGTTSQGGTSGYGTVFALNTNGTGFSLVHVFTNGPDGAQPRAGMIILNNILYGTTAGTGSNNSFGTIFSLNTNGSLAAIHSFNTNIEGGSTKAGLTLFNNVLYGATYQYGSNGSGSIFSINTDGNGFGVVHSFVPASDGGQCAASLLAWDNALFGTTSAGGANTWGTVFSFNGANFSVLHAFSGDTEGGASDGSLTAMGNTLYGTTQQGGLTEGGTVFSVRTNGAGFVLLHTFNGLDGLSPSSPSGGLTLSGKTAFGTTTFGGATGANGGSVFSITVPILSIAGFAPQGSNAVFNAVDGLAGGTYSVLMSSNVAAPASQWKSIATNVPSTNGPFTIIATNGVDSSAANRFYMIQLQ